RPEDMMALQNDNYNLQAAESLPLMLSMLDSVSLRADERRIAEELGYWNYFSSAHSLEASHYELWWNTLQRLIWDEMLNKNVTLEMPDDDVTIQIMKTKPDFAFYDIESTPEKETLKTLVQMAFSASVKSISEWERTHNK